MTLKLDTLSSFSDFQFHTTDKVEILEIGYILVKFFIDFQFYTTDNVEILEIGYILVKFIGIGYRAYPISMNFICKMTSIVRKI